jgi:hypothetical protein
MVVLTYRKINVLDFPLAILKALQLNGTQWNPRIGLFVVQDFTPGPFRRPIPFLTSSHPRGRLSKITNLQIQRVKK